MPMPESSSTLRQHYKQAYQPLKHQTLQRIASDYGPRCCRLIGIGVTGSFARMGDRKGGDIDLILQFSDDMEFACNCSRTVRYHLKKILGDQFRKDTDFITYTRMMEGIRTPREFDYQPGYANMLKDLVWLWRRENHEIHE